MKIVYVLNCIFAKSISMKRIFFILSGLVALSAAFSSCTSNNLAQKLHFDLGMQPISVNITIPAANDTSAGVTVNGYTAYNVDSFIRAQTGGNLGASNIQSVKLKAVTMTLNNATPTANFQDFESCSASFYSNSNSQPYSISIPSNPDTYSEMLSLPVDQNAELKSYLGNQFTYTVSGKLRHPVKSQLSCTVTFTFDVVVQG